MVVGRVRILWWELKQFARLQFLLTARNPASWRYRENGSENDQRSMDLRMLEKLLENTLKTIHCTTSNTQVIKKPETSRISTPADGDNQRQYIKHKT